MFLMLSVSLNFLLLLINNPNNSYVVGFGHGAFFGMLAYWMNRQITKDVEKTVAETQRFIQKVRLDLNEAKQFQARVVWANEAQKNRAEFWRAKAHKLSSSKP